jgi:hypothetical protein
MYTVGESGRYHELFEVEVQGDYGTGVLLLSSSSEPLWLKA